MSYSAQGFASLVSTVRVIRKCDDLNSCPDWAGLSPGPGDAMNNTRIIMKYTNRRLYDTSESHYITLGDVRELVLSDIEFVVIELTSQRDITIRVLLQIVSEQERSGEPILGRDFLLQAIRIHGSPLQSGVGECLRKSISAFVSQSEGNRRAGKNSLHATATADVPL
jgi:polyhydroxyalkanoate synthesis repressor PhaR